MIPILYPYTEKKFKSNGIGALCDVISCEVTEERNGSYELEMEYPLTGKYYKDIELGSIILAKPYEDGNPQAFDIYKISKPLDGIITINASHISYRLCYIPVQNFFVQSVTKPRGLFEQFVANAILDPSKDPLGFPFEIDDSISDDPSTADSYLKELPTSFRECLGGSEKSLLQLYHGEYTWDNFKIYLNKNRGRDLGVHISYSKNLTDLKQELDDSNALYSVLPYWASSYTEQQGDKKGAKKIVLGSSIVTPTESSLHYAYTRAEIVDVSNKLSLSTPDPDAVKTAGENYLASSDRVTIKDNLKVSFVALWQTEEYKNIAPLEKVHLCDTVWIDCPDIGISYSAKVISTRYDVLVERYLDITLGDAKSNFVTAMNQTQEETKKSVTQQITQITEDTIMTTNITAENLKVKAANIGTITTNDIRVVDEEGSVIFEISHNTTG